MYKLLLCWRYLRTRYLAMVCIVSVMLGVATLIVVNSVMGGFSTKLRERLHGLLSDVVLEAYDPVHGFANPEQKMAVIRADPFLNERVEAMAPTLEIFAMIQFSYGQSDIARPVKLIGIDAESRSRVGGFAEFLVNSKDRPRFELTPEAKKHNEARNRFKPGLQLQPPMQFETVDGKPPPDPPPSRPFVPECAVVGYAIAHFRDEQPDETGNYDRCLLRPGDDIHLTTISGYALKPVNARFAVCDYFKSEMSEYDSNYVFVPLQYLQQLRTMEGRVTSIQIRLKDELGDKAAVVKRLKELFQGTVQVLTWEDKQGPLLAAISIEKGILNILLFLIIAVAGFGILAIFSMIVVEKTRDIGILKALGASNGGVLKIFLGYGLLLGIVGAALGTCLGVSITVYINDIEKFLATATGQEIFPRKIYYFDQIPTDIRSLHVALISAGSIAIAVLFSVLPALRAAMLHPVRALRYE